MTVKITLASVTIRNSLRNIGRKQGNFVCAHTFFEHDAFMLWSAAPQGEASL